MKLDSLINLQEVVLDIIHQASRTQVVIVDNSTLNSSSLPSWPQDIIKTEDTLHKVLILDKVNTTLVAVGNSEAASQKEIVVNTMLSTVSDSLVKARITHLALDNVNHLNNILLLLSKLTSNHR